MKALATITVWVLWLSGLVMGFSSLIMGTIGGDLFNPQKLMPMQYPATFAVSGFFAFVALIGMKIRKDLE